MSSSRIPLEKILSDQEYRKIDDFGGGHAGVANLKAMAGFLEDEFGLSLNLDPDIIAGFAGDSSNLPARAEALARPENRRQAAIILRAARAAKIPVTLSGGRSNLTGSATAEGGILLSTARFTEPAVAVDREQLRVTCPVNIIVEELREKILEETADQLYFPVDPTSRGDAWVGGMIACNASGFTPGEVGAAREWILGLDIILPSGLGVRARRGDYVSADGAFTLDDGGNRLVWPVPTYPRPAIKNASGPFSNPEGRIDLIDMLVGSEGIYGLVCGAELKLAPRPIDYIDLFFSLPEESQALAFYSFMEKELKNDFSGLSAFEYFGVNCLSYMDHQEKLFHGDNQVAIYLQIPVTAGRDLDEETERWFNLLLQADCGIEPEAVILLDNPAKRRIFMESRHSMPANALEVIQRYGTYTIMTDTVVPPARFAEFLQYLHGLLRQEKLDYLSFGHFGDCHLHFTLLPDQDKLARATELYDLFIEKAVALGGVYSGEHGTGKRKRKDFLKLYNPAAVAELKKCKAALDPDLLVNRGNIFLP
ncbi:MAG: FAD-binding oxidoreductase [Deltaproteobacteria bacterium]|nr:FAD-binding oxidoreductase [Deltaproteobacteria bacterium]